MRILVAPDSFKGCLSSIDVCKALTVGIKEFNSNIDVIQFPSSDGGEGFCDCMKHLFGGMFISREVTAPLGTRVIADYIFNPKTNTAYIEFASASGLQLVPKESRNILFSTSYGVGELIKDAVALGARKIVVGLGGSATNDYGLGILSALGMSFYAENSVELVPIPKNLDRIHMIDKSNMIDLSHIEFFAACDVQNPLCGENGAAKIFARQKGANENEIEYLDMAAKHFCEVLGIDMNVSGYGAAGGAGMALMSILRATYLSGAELLVNSKEFQSALETVDLIITGEGNTDSQSAFGKLVSVILNAANSKGIKSIVISGGLSTGYDTLGANEYFALCEGDVDIEYSMTHAFELIKEKVKFALLNSKN